MTAKWKASLLRGWNKVCLVIEEPVAVADALRDFLSRGFGSDNPAIENITRPGAMKNLDASSSSQ